MRITTKTNNISKSFKLKQIVVNEMSEMEGVKDVRNFEPSYNKEDFAEKCLERINKLHGSDEYVINKQNIKSPDWKNFKNSCNREWHLEKSKRLDYRSYQHDNKGWLKVRIDPETPKEILDKLGIQSKDKIFVRIEKHNDRLKRDKKLIGDTPKGFIE